ncbi:MAG: hypothetical protein QNI90_05590 [Dinoroseobacter sp.]|nr:hypothetical protein [Dinoroseobacter sp.]
MTEQNADTDLADLVNNKVAEFIELERAFACNGFMGMEYFTLLVELDVLHVDAPEPTDEVGAYIGDERISQGYLYVPEEKHVQLLEAAIENREAFELLKHVIGRQLMARDPLTPILSLAAGSIILGVYKGPRSFSAKKRAKNGFRDGAIILLMMLLVDTFSLRPTQNAERSRKTEPSASELISLAYKKHGRHEVTTRAVREVWGNNKKRAQIERRIKASGGLGRLTIVPRTSAVRPA